jgi:hypothetical protein
MNKEQVPQDENSLLNHNFKSVVYALDNDGRYTTVPSIGWEPENLALRQTWDSINENIEQIKNKVISGEISPVAYFMAKYQYRVKRLASLTGFPKRKIRKHLNPEAFAKADQESLETYSNVFQITIDQLIKPF